ncbi:MAG: hypothetical protein AAB337_03430 [Patescibacteria group bacterium]
MFDEEPKDIFDDKAPVNLPIGGSRPPAVVPPPAPQVPAPVTVQQIPSVPSETGGKRLILFALLGLVIIIVAVLLGYWLLSTRPSNEVVDNDILEELGEVTEVTDETEGIEDTQERESQSPVVDSDGDGLTDAQELEAGTDLDNSDSDDDGLGDRAEVEVYDTDPLNPDTDGDSYSDGSEVSNSYNPNGSGRLFQVP